MADYITKIRTADGDKQIDYLSLANRPEIPVPITQGGTGATSKPTARKALGIYSGTELPTTTSGYHNGDIFFVYYQAGE